MPIIVPSLGSVVLNNRSNISRHLKSKIASSMFAQKSVTVCVCYLDG
uniref:Uncharacterized protein n=1 Tax=Anguilla anguilla TaxID=7936 RepID=A0A0E9U8N6_ANGAN